MRVIQTVNDTIRLLFNPKTEVFSLSDFLLVRDADENFLAQVVEVYDDCNKNWIGKRVVGEINCGCNNDSWCAKGLARHCPNRQTLGIWQKDGCFSEYFTLPVENLLEVPQSLSDEEATFVEPVAAAMEITEQLHIKPKDKVALLGDGKLGLCIALVLNALNVDLVHIGKHENKLEISRKAGVKTKLLKDLEGSDNKSFDIVIEIIDRNTLAIYKDSATAVDYILRGWPISPEIRKVDGNYKEKKPEINILKKVEELENKTLNASQSPLSFNFNRQKYVQENKKHKKIYIYAVSRSIVDKLIERLDIDAQIVRNVEEADFVIAHKNFAKGGTKILATANEYHLPVFFVRTNSMSQIQRVLKEALNLTQENQEIQSLTNYKDATELALDETNAAIAKLSEGAEVIELEPQEKQIRKLQHELVEAHGYRSVSVGEGNLRHLKIFKDE